MPVQTVFERNEKKFLLAKHQLAGLLAQLSPHMAQDSYGLHTICSLYLDTPDGHFARLQADKPTYREKLRLRSYGVPTNNSTVYLELKKKLAGVTYKRRMPLPLCEAKAYLQMGVAPTFTGQVFGEIDWFMHQYQPKPRTVVCYDRIALYGLTDAALRVTFDDNARFRDTQLDLARGDWGQPLTAPGTILMEVKTIGAMPVWLARILSQNGLYAQSFSKFGGASQSITQQEVCQYAG